ncbi:MAG: hypothetical protein AB2392_14930 [Neobacillus sp.]|jgi:hypothetical protein
MLRKVGRRFFWLLIGSTIFTTLIGYVLFKAGLLAIPGHPNSQRSTNIKIRHQNKRIGRMKVN